MKISKFKLVLLLGFVVCLILAFGISFYFTFSKYQTSNVQKQASDSTLLVTTVPEPNTKNVDTSISIPKVVMNIVKDSHNQTRVFAISAKNNSLSENKLVVYEGDIVSIRFSAEDRNYDLTFPDFNISQNTPAGITKILEFQTQNSGNYPFLCTTCDSNNPFSPNKVKGELVVIQRNQS
jgi:heme/copper-type cytochrome/quinol oxidase subunit 2